MTQLLSLIEVLWKPEEVLNRKVTWFLPYIASVLLISGLGLYTNYRMGDRLTDQLTQLGVNAEGLALFQRGSYIGIAIVSLFLPIIIPWGAAFISKLIALFSGSRITFADFFSLYQWGYYVSTLVGVVLKGILFVMLPVDAWGGITLSLAAVMPNTAPGVLALANAVDLTVLVLFAVAFLGLKGRRMKKELTIPVWTFIAFLVVQFTAAS